MYALAGRVEIKPGHEEVTEMMARDHGPSLVSGMAGSGAAYWARGLDDSGRVIQYSFWLFETEENARAAETVFSSLRDMPDAPAGFYQCRRVRSHRPGVGGIAWASVPE